MQGLGSRERAPDYGENVWVKTFNLETVDKPFEVKFLKNWSYQEIFIEHILSGRKRTRPHQSEMVDERKRMGRTKRTRESASI